MEAGKPSPEIFEKVFVSAVFVGISGLWVACWASNLFRAACLQNEIAPEHIMSRCEKLFEKRERVIRK